MSNRKPEILHPRYESGAIHLPIALQGLRGAPVECAHLTITDALRIAGDLISAAHLAHLDNQ